jgi:hypothetical protein
VGGLVAGAEHTRPTVDRDAVADARVLALAAEAMLLLLFAAGPAELEEEAAGNPSGPAPLLPVLAADGGARR